MSGGFDQTQAADEVIGETELYQVVFPTVTRRYTSAKIPLVYQANTYEPLAIKRGEIERSQDVGPATLKVSLPTRPEFTDLVTQSGLTNISVTIIRGFGDPASGSFTTTPWFSGTVIELNINRVQTDATIRSMEHLFETKVPRTVMQAPCNNRLGDATCGVNLETGLSPIVAGVPPINVPFKGTGIVASVSANGTTIGVNYSNMPSTGWPIVNPTTGSGWFTLGTMRTPGLLASYREIIRHDTSPGTNTLFIHVAIAGLAVGNTIETLAGDDKAHQTCLSKFNNLTRFVGFPYIPRQDPVLQGL